MLIFLYNQKEIDWFNGRVYDEENNLIPDFYDERGCPTVPVAISSLTGRLGNIISTYVNFIALEYKLGYKYHLPYFMNKEHYSEAKPYLSSIFKNVSFPTALWTNFSNSNFRDLAGNEEMLFNNSRSHFQNLTDCDLNYIRRENVVPLFEVRVGNRFIWNVFGQIKGLLYGERGGELFACPNVAS